MTTSGKELLTRLIVCSLQVVISLFVILDFSNFGFEDRIMALFCTSSLLLLTFTFMFYSICEVYSNACTL